MKQIIQLAFMLHAMSLQLCPTLQPHGLQPSRLLCPWGFPGKDTGRGCHALLLGIFPTQGLNSCLLLSHGSTPFFGGKKEREHFKTTLREQKEKLKEFASYELYLPMDIEGKSLTNWDLVLNEGIDGVLGSSEITEHLIQDLKHQICLYSQALHPFNLPCLHFSYSLHGHGFDLLD